MDTIRVIKIGGKVAENEETLNRFMAEFHLLKGSKILVHGGGVLATNLAEKLGIKTKMVDGRRVTDDDTIDIVTMVYGGLVNKKVVAKLQALGQNAIGLTGADLNIIYSNKRNPVPLDFGWVGDIEFVQSDWLKVFLEQGVVPVIAPLTHNGNGDLLNTNADNIAGFLASELAKRYTVQLTFCFDRPGVMNGEEIIDSISLKDFEKLKKEGIISDGMIPKLDLGFQALSNAVDKVTIKHMQDLNTEQTGTELTL